MIINQPIPIDAAGRFVYRSLKRNFGVIAMRQRGVRYNAWDFYL
ncbi:MAG: hypothetical protein U5M51_03815 [Emticicia sp.]|nr:hypothetical protein [Emticicia sp.]